MLDLRSRLTTSRLDVLVLLAAALVLRLYHLAHDPLWLDEIYGWSATRSGIAVLLQNTAWDPHPPFFYLLEWASSGFDLLHSEVGWRWLAAVSGGLSVPVVYLAARRAAGRWPAVICAGLLAIAPTHIYFSQEAREYALAMLVSAATLLLLPALSARPQRSLPWVAFGALTVLGLNCSYSYALVVAVQVPYLLLVAGRERRLYLALGGASLVLLPLGPLALNAVGRAAGHNAAAAPLGLVSMSQALLAGEPLRYGYGWWHAAIPVALGVLAAFGAWQALRLRRTDPSGLYLLAQAVLPPAAFFLIGTQLLDIRMPLYESKQFMVLLPAFFVLAALGCRLLFGLRWRPLGLAVVAVAFVAVCAGSYLSLLRYWTIGKSPEGQAARVVAEQAAPGDAVGSLHYSTDAALLFYVAQAPGTRADPQNVFLSQRLLGPGAADEGSLAAMRSHMRVWIVSHASTPVELVARLLQGCSVVRVWDFPPFRLTLAQDCLRGASW